MIVIKDRSYWDCSRQFPQLSGPMPRNGRSAAKILLVEHRDEVFARLENDLRTLGHEVYRATRAVDVARIYAYAKIDLVISNPELPDASVWLMATKLRMVNPMGRIWLYAARKSVRDRLWGEHAGIERILYYQGNLFLLSQLVAKACCNLRAVECPEVSAMRAWQRQESWETRS